jgi:hypothetical protein
MLRENQNWAGRCCWLLVLPLLLTGIGRTQQAESKPIVSDKSLTPDELAAYRVVLGDFMDNSKGKHPVILAIQTLPFYLSDMDADCGKNFHMDEGAVGEIHRFRPENIPALISGKMKASALKLVDPEAQAREVADNDPDKAIHKGKSISDAVENGFAHGMVQLGEIHFDHEHLHAILSVSFSCGSLCGNGTTVILEKKDGRWGFKGHCSTSIAEADFPASISASVFPNPAYPQIGHSPR